MSAKISECNSCAKYLSIISRIKMGFAQVILKILVAIQKCDGCKRLDRGHCILEPTNHCIRQAEDYYEPY